MTATPALLIDNAWPYPPDDARPVLARVADGAVRLTVYGTDDAMVIPAADWLTLAAWTVAQLRGPQLQPGDKPTARTAPAATQPTPTAPDLDEATILARLRALSPDGVMPPATAWNAQRGSLPHSSTLYTRRKWSEWGKLAGLRVLTPRERALARQDGDAPAADHTPTAQLLATLPPPEDTPTPPPRSPGAMVVDEAAVVAELQRLAVDGVMPSRITYDTERIGEAMPASSTLVRRQPWADWARLAGLRIVTGRPATATATPTAERVAARKAAAEAARAALLERTRHALTAMAPDGHMPPLPQYDAAKPADLPLGGELLHRLGLDSWGELAHACGLAYRPGRAEGHRNGNHTAQPVAA